MTTHATPAYLDSAAVARWPVRIAAHLLGLGLTLAVLVALPVAITDLDRHQLPKETIVHLAVWLAVLLARPLPPRSATRALRWGLLGLISVTVLSSLFATNPWLALRAASLTITLAAAFVTTRHLALLGERELISKWCFVAAATGCTAGLAQAYGLESTFFATTRIPGGTFGNRNFLAHFCALAFPLVATSTLTTARRRTAIFSSILAAALLGTIILTRSRAAWLGVAVGCAVLFAGLLLARRRGLAIPPQRVKQLGIALALGIVLAMVLPNALDWKSDSPYTDTLAGITNSQEGSGRGRILQYEHSLSLAIKHPILGVGPGNWPIHFGEVAPANDPSWIPTDIIPLNPWPSSDWVALLTERGPIAVIAVLLIGCALCWRSWLGIKAGGDRALAGAALAALLLTAALQGTFDAVMLLAAPGLLVALTGATLLVRTDGVETTDPLWLSAPPKWSVVVPIILGVIALRSVMQTTAYIVAGAGHDKQHLTLAAQIDPGSYPLHMALAQRGSCPDARAALKLAPLWPAAKAAAKRCSGER